MLYVRPVVTAFDAKNNKTSGEGPIVPLFPEGTFPDATLTPAATAKNGFVLLNRGITNVPTLPVTLPGVIPAILPNTPDPASETGGSFQIFDGNGRNDSWKWLKVDPPTATTGPTASSAWSLTSDQSSIQPINFALLSASSNAYNTAARTRATLANDGTTALLIYEGVIQYNVTAATTTTSGKSSRGWRLVGHFGFLNGTRSGGSAEVGVSVELSPSSALKVPIPIPRDLAGANTDLTISPAAGAKGSFFTYGNNLATGGIPITNPASGPVPPMQLLNIPIRFDLLDAAVSAGAGPYPAYPTPLGMPAAHFAAPLPTGQVLAPPAVPLAMKQSDYTAYKNARDAVGKYMTVTVTIFIDTTKAQPGDSVGIFGLRLVPDIYY